MFNDDEKYNGHIPHIKYLPTDAIEHSGMAGEVRHVSDDVARNMDFSEPVETTAFRYGRNHDEYEPSVVLSNGHHRLAAAKQMGIPYLPVTVHAINAKGHKLNALKSLSDEIEGRIHKDDGGGITAYHGSPHEFDQFDTSKIGTGEGAQAYGHGLYFAESEPVAKSYRDALESPKISVKGKEFPLASQAANEIYPNIDDPNVLYPVHHALTRMQVNGMDLDKAIDDMHFNYSHYDPEHVKKAEQLVRSANPEIKNKGHMYEVHIDAHPDHFLDWDRPLRNQSEHVQNALRSLGFDPEKDWTHSSLRGQNIYKRLVRSGSNFEKLGVTSQAVKADEADASKILSDHGIHGIRYLDAGSRGDTDQPTHNYVVFDHNRVNIKRRYAEGGEVEAYGDGGEVDRRKMSHKDVTKRVPELTEGAQKLAAGEITKEDYDDLVNTHKPITPYDSVPRPATHDEMFNALQSHQVDKIGKSHEIPEGTPVSNRLDIPAYIRHETWVPVTHEQKSGFQAGAPLSYNSVSHVKDATLGVHEKAALNYSQGKSDKGTWAVIKGNHVHTTPEEAHAMATAALDDPEWVQVGMDPERHSYFYDRKTTQPIVSAARVLQVGPLVLAHKPVYGKKEDFAFREGGEVGRVGFGYGGDTEFAGSKPERGGSGSVAAAHEAPAQAERSYRDMPEHLQEAQRDLSSRNEQVINAMKEANAADKQRKAEQMTAWAGAGFPSGGPQLMALGEETRPTAYTMADISKKSPAMQSQADIIASLAPPPQHYESSFAGNQIAPAPMPQHYEPTFAQNQIAPAPMPQHYESTFAQNQIAPAPQQMAFMQPARPITPTPANKPIQLASLDSSTFKPASPMPDFQPQGGKGGRRLVKKLMPDGTYQDVWEEYANGGVAKSPAKLHNSAIIEHALGKVGAPPPAFGQTLSVAKRGRPL